MQDVATYYYLNATLAAAGTATTRYGVGPSTIGVAGISKWMGVAAICANDGTTYSVGRGLYAEGLHYNNNGYTVGIECQVGNMTGTTLPTANPYSMVDSAVNCLYLGAESGYGLGGYKVGTTAPGSPITVPTQPCGAAIDISGGFDNQPFQKFVVGIVFRNGALHHYTVGSTTGIGKVVSLAQKHQLDWVTSANGFIGTYIRGEVTGVSEASGLKLKNRGAAFVGSDYERIICDFRDELGDARASSSIIGDGTTATVVTTSAHGYSNGDVVFVNQAVPQGFNGNHTVTVVDATTFTFPSTVNATATTQAVISRPERNYLQIRNHRTANAPAIHALGTDADVDIGLTTKGTGTLKFGTYTAGASSVTGYITVKDAAGNTRKLAVIA
jgi:hypothetical protein